MFSRGGDGRVSGHVVGPDGAFDGEVHSRWGIPRRRFMPRNLHPACLSAYRECNGAAAGEKVQRMRRHWTPARVERLMIVLLPATSLFDVPAGDVVLPTSTFCSYVGSQRIAFFR